MIKPSSAQAFPKVNNVLLNICLMIFSCLLLFILLEVSARIYLFHGIDEERFLRYASLTQIKKHFGGTTTPLAIYERHRYLGYYPTPNYVRGANRHNSLGYRGDEIIQPKPAGEFRIVCVGGSTTYSTEVKDYRKSYPYLLQQELWRRGFRNTTVINAGAGSWTSWETLVNFEFRILDLTPDLIIDYDSLNDIMSRFVWPVQAYRGDNSGRRAPASSDFSKVSFWENSTLLRILLIRAGRIRPQADLETSIDKSSKSYYAYQFYLQKVQGKYPDGVFKKVSAMKMLQVNKPIYFERNLKNLVTLARDHGVKTVLATFAYSPFFTDPKVTSEEYVYGYQEHEGIMKMVAEENDAYLFDFAQVFPKDKKYFTDGVHMNEQGSLLMAKFFADYIEKNNLIEVGEPLSPSAKH